MEADVSGSPLVASRKLTHRVIFVQMKHFTSDKMSLDYEVSNEAFKMGWREASDFIGNFCATVKLKDLTDAARRKCRDPVRQNASEKSMKAWSMARLKEAPQQDRPMWSENAVERSRLYQFLTTKARECPPQLDGFERAEQAATFMIVPHQNALDATRADSSKVLYVSEADARDTLYPVVVHSVGVAATGGVGDECAVQCAIAAPVPQDLQQHLRQCGQE